MFKTFNKFNTLFIFSAGLLIATIFSPAAIAQVVHKSSDFNHMRTGFPLTGVHTNVECETCHVGGIFKGTPKDCAGCHSPGRRVMAPAKNATHIVTSAPCDSCHNNSISFLGARFNHIGVNPRSCLTCHNGVMAPGKPGGHPVTTSPCDSCHRPNTWLPAGYDHAGVAAGTCANCHNGSNPNIVSKTATHIVTTAACDTCHHNFNTFIGGTFDHATSGVVAGSCDNCHVSGSNGAKTKPGNHIQYNAGVKCDACHTTGYTSFVGPGASSTTMHTTYMNLTACKTCHSANTYLGVTGPKKSVTHDRSSPVPTDCNDAGCHLPGAGGRGTVYSIW